MTKVAIFSDLDAVELDRLARQNGFRTMGSRTWARRTAEFVQVVNLQRSQWSNETRYLNFALWPLALGEPTSFAESKFHFRTRAESMAARGLREFFTEADKLTTLVELAEALETNRISGLVSKDLRPLLTPRA
ncbi:DUF4304 domain-containing protein [Silicimonas sp. MF1-12-2]|uniref:DUF4304 domain-containing protein n=1 Tax=Silicimonas sp. MF1-12-2 TaxID=3384793 RepID=UPI0039B4A5A3